MSTTIEDLYTRYHTMVYRRALGLLSDHEAAEDAVQDTFIKVWRALPPLEERGVTAWIYTIVTNVCRDFHRKAACRPQGQPLDTIVSTEAELYSEDMTACESLSLVVFSQLPAKLQQVCLVHARGYTSDEIAERLHIAGCTVDMRLHRARVALRRAYAELQREEVAV